MGIKRDEYNSDRMGCCGKGMGDEGMGVEEKMIRVQQGDGMGCCRKGIGDEGMGVKGNDESTTVMGMGDVERKRA